jgi:predicted Zn-ribbon and HTH transcriptional regulator
MRKYAIAPERVYTSIRQAEKTMKRYYLVTCLKCKKQWRWDDQKPKPCPACGSEWGEYKKYLVILKDWHKAKDG